MINEICATAAAAVVRAVGQYRASSRCQVCRCLSSSSYGRLVCLHVFCDIRIDHNASHDDDDDDSACQRVCLQRVERYLDAACHSVS